MGGRAEWAKGRSLPCTFCVFRVPGSKVGLADRQEREPVAASDEKQGAKKDKKGKGKGKRKAIAAPLPEEIPKVEGDEAEDDEEEFPTFFGIEEEELNDEDEEVEAEPEFDSEIYLAFSA